MGKHICIHCGSKRINIDLGIRRIKMNGQPDVVGFVCPDGVNKTLRG